VSTYLRPGTIVTCRCEVTRLDGADFLEEISITDRATITTRAQPCSGLVWFIGAGPATNWLLVRIYAS
jgi:hypothetical protein